MGLTGMVETSSVMIGRRATSIIFMRTGEGLVLSGQTARSAYASRLSIEGDITLSVPTNWWQTFFSGMIVESWLRMVGEEQTKGEVEFIERELGISPPARILDVPCGGGRHSLALAVKGFQMTGVDISTDFLKAARESAADRKLSVRWEERDMRDLPWRQEFDGAFCFGNSFGYYDDAGNVEFLKAVAGALKPDAKFVLDTGCLFEGILFSFQDRNWYQVGDIKLLRNARYDPPSSRIETEYTMIREGQTEVRSALHRIFTYRELFDLVSKSGFKDVKAFGGLNREPFVLGSKRLLLVATKS
jgi:SAM-dependent methyltransferase